MNFWQLIVYVIVPSGIVSTIVSGLITHFSSKKLDAQQRTMEIRKNLYTNIGNQLALFVDTVSKKESDDARDDLIKYFREIQIWGSDKVVRSFSKLLEAMADKSYQVDKRNFLYKEFIVAMRMDILGSTNVAPDEINIRGIIKK